MGSKGRWFFLVPFIVISLLFMGMISGGASQVSQGLFSFSVVQSPLEVKLSGPGSVTEGDIFWLTATVTNRGERRLRDGEITLNIESSPGIDLAGPPWTRRLGTLQPGHSREATWRLEAADVGKYLATAEASFLERETGSRLVMGDRMEIEVVSAAEAVRGYFNRLSSSLRQQVESMLSFFRK